MLGRVMSDQEPTDPEDADPSVAVLVALLESLAESPDALAELPDDLLGRLRVASGRLALPDRLERRRFNQARRRARRREDRARDDAALEATSNRARKRALAFPRPPLGASLPSGARGLLEEQARERPADPSAESLGSDRCCYVCKSAFRRVHHHYDSMCPACGDLNWSKRHQSGDLTGRVALVTGARVKIGFEVALKLLRAGARVIGTSRFRVDAARRFSAEPDFADWSDRLEVHGLDLRNTPSVEAFCDQFQRRESRLDFLIHNACQTVRRPPAYYAERVASEDPAALPARARGLLESRGEEGAIVPSGDPGDVAALSVLDLLGEASLAPLFPAGIEDGEGQPLDLRDQNSWRMDLHEVSTLELLEVQLVNAVAPFVINGRLKPLLLAVPTGDKHIVHVSAMEGQFYRTFKTTRHPHTNMAKAALNMMTRTSAADFVRDGIHMNSVDTGWVTDEDPFAKAVEKDASQGFMPPLDSVDGAARVLDPIFSGLESGHHAWGQFLKDYAPTPW